MVSPIRGRVEDVDLHCAPTGDRVRVESGQEITSFGATAVTCHLL